MKSILLILLLVISKDTFCQQKVQWLDFGPFRVKAASQWTIIKMEGADSYIGGITNQKDTLTFDYGIYYTLFSKDSLTKVSYGIVKGKWAQIATPRTISKGTTGIGYRRLFRRTTIGFSGENLDKETHEEALKIFKSVKFKKN